MRFYFRFLHWVYDWMFRQAMKERIMSAEEMWVWRSRVAWLKERARTPGETE